MENEKENSKKHKKSSSIFPIVLVIMVAIAGFVGVVSFLFFGSPDISISPATISVNEISGSYCIVAEYNPNYNYNFIVEQKIEGDYIYICEKNMSCNILNLEDCENVLLRSGAEYRFKVAYAIENGRAGAYTDYVEWKYKDYLEDTDVNFADGILSWNIENAQFFDVVLIKPDFSRENFDGNTSGSINLSTYAEGDYVVYITAYSESYLSSVSICNFKIVS